MSTFGVIYEQAGDGSWSARAADLPVYAVGDTAEEAEREIRSAIAFYLEELTSSGEELPATSSILGTVDV